MTRIGRPPISGEAKRVQFNTRIRHGVRETLQLRAEKAGRSLSEEIEKALEESVRDNPIVERLDRIIEIMLRQDAETENLGQRIAELARRGKEAEARLRGLEAYIGRIESPESSH